METIRLADNLQDAAQRAAAALHNNGVVVFPTDTLYGLAADAFSNEAVDKIYAIKGRDEAKPIHALVRDLDMAARFAEITDEVRLLVDRVPKGKVTFICRKKAGLETGIARGLDTFGFRIPDSDFCITMIEQFGGPVTATSANVAGMQPQRSIDAIVDQFENSDTAHHLEMVAVAIDGGELPPSAPSTVVSFAGDRPQILREGVVPAAVVMSVLQTAAPSQV